MSEKMEQVIIHKDSKFQFAEGTPAEIVDQMPDNVVKSLAAVSLSNDNLTSFVSNGVMVRLEKEAGKKGSHRVSFTSPSAKPAPSSVEFHPERVRNMEITQKEYIDQRIDSLEKSIDHRFDSTEKLLSEKMDHLAARLEGAINNQNTKIDGQLNLIDSNLNRSLDTKLNAFKEELNKNQKSTRNNIIVWTLGGGAILATVGVAVFQYILS